DALGERGGLRRVRPLQAGAPGIALSWMERKDSMDGRKTIAIVAALVGCAIVHPSADSDLAAGHWIGEIDRGGRLQPFALDIDGTPRGEWRSERGLRSVALQNFDVTGDTVRFETDELLFVGRVQGQRLSGTVSRKGAGVPEAAFSVTHQEPRLHPDDEATSGVTSSGSPTPASLSR